MKKIVYTCITSNYDEIPTDKPYGDYDYICFLDELTYETQKNKIKIGSGIEYRIISFSGAAQEINRHLKISPHEYLHEYDLSIYVDGNIKLIKNPFDLFLQIPENKAVSLYSQPHRNCAFLELDELVRNGVAKGSDVIKIKRSFKALGMPRNNGLFEANIILRRHNDIRCILLMRIWWKLWENALVKRDQPYLAFVHFLTNNSIIHCVGPSNLHANQNPFFCYGGRINKKNKIIRLFRRIRSELQLYRLLG